MVENSQLRAALAAANAKIAALETRLSELGERIDQNSQNSDRSPSSDPPSTPVPPPKTKSRRKPGGQLGHEAHQRKLAPPELIKKSTPVKPKQCRKCGAGLDGEDPKPYPHQVWEWPDIKPDVFEWLLHELTCKRCGAKTRAALPPGVPRVGFGPRLVAVIALLSGAYRLSKRLVVDLLGNLAGIPISLGSVSACEQLASEAVSKPVMEARTYVQEQSVKHADESSWFEGPKRARVWLWTASTALVTVFLIRASRGKDVAKKLLGKVCGVLVSDRWCAYAWWPLKLRQLCWAHIKRHFKAMEEAGKKAGKVGTQLLTLEKRLFDLWHRVRDGTLQRSTFRKHARTIRREVKTLLKQGSRCSHKKTATTCAELLKLEPAMWTFVRIEGVEPTNNNGEHAIRPGVMWRKLCFGTHSRRGSRFVERMLTVVYTLRQQKRNALAFLTQCVEAQFRAEVAGSLLPAGR